MSESREETLARSYAEWRSSIYPRRAHILITQPHSTKCVFHFLFFLLPRACSSSELGPFDQSFVGLKRRIPLAWLPLLPPERKRVLKKRTPISTPADTIRSLRGRKKGVKKVGYAKPEPFSTRYIKSGPFGFFFILIAMKWDRISAASQN